MLDHLEASLHRLGVPPGARLLLAVSGGADSMALLRLCQGLDRPVRVFHLNHQARPDADEAAEFVRTTCAAAGVPACIESADVPALGRQHHVSFETAARRERYRRALALQGADEWLATAHTMDDQAETVLLRLLRGAGPRGLGGIHPRREHRLIRPLLDVRRDDLRTWLTDRSFRWREDPTNADQTVPRNRIRHELMPLLMTYNPRIVPALHRLATIMRLDEAALEAAADVAADTRWDTHPRAIQVRLLRRVEGLDDATFDQLQAILSLSPGQRYRRGPHLYQWRDGEVQTVPPRVSSRWGPIPLPRDGRVWLHEAGLSLVVEADEASTPSASEAIRVPTGLSLTVRNRRSGDRIHPVGSPGSKTLKKFFIDEKVPRAMRDTIPIVVTTTNEVVWVVGWRPDRRFLADPRQPGIRLSVDRRREGGQHPAPG